MGDGLTTIPRPTSSFGPPVTRPRQIAARDGLAITYLAIGLLALDADTGKLNWYFQFTKHDTHDWDATEVPVIIDTGGKHLIVQANRNGFFYILDRTTWQTALSNSVRHRQLDP